MATTTETDDKTMVSVNGGPAVPMDSEEADRQIEAAAEEALNNAGLDRIRQLSFDVGGQAPNRSSVKTSVDLIIPRELHKGSQVRVSVATPDGEVLASSIGKVVAVGFEDEYNKDGFLVGTERVHKVKLAI